MGDDHEPAIASSDVAIDPEILLELTPARWPVHRRFAHAFLRRRKVPLPKVATSSRTPSSGCASRRRTWHRDVHRGFSDFLAWTAYGLWGHEIESPRRDHEAEWDAERDNEAPASEPSPETGSPLDGLAVVKADRAMALPRFKEIARGYDYVFLDGPPRLAREYDQQIAAMDEELARKRRGEFIPGDAIDDEAKKRRKKTGT